MIGDKIVAKPHHKRAAKSIYSLLYEKLAGERAVLTVAGESGSGKSEIAGELAKLFKDGGLPVIILQQDDYFFYPPKTNHQMRLKDIKHVGMSEVNLTLLNKHLEEFKSAQQNVIEKPLVIFNEDKVSREKFNPADYSILIAEGTYTTCLNSSDFRIFINRDYKYTLRARMERDRDKIDEFSEKVLRIEHEIISKHKKMASIIVNRDYSVTMV